MVASVIVSEKANAFDITSEMLTAAVQVNEHGQAIDAQGEYTYVVLVVVETANATEVFYCAPVFNLSEKVWHIGPRPDYWEACAVDRPDFWEAGSVNRPDYWESCTVDRPNLWAMSPRLTFWRPNE